MNHFPLWFPNTQRSEQFPQVTVMKGSLAQVKVTGFTERRLGQSVHQAVSKWARKKVVSKKCVEITNNVPNGKTDALPPARRLVEAETQPCSLLPPGPSPEAVLGCASWVRPSLPVRPQPPSASRAALELAPNPKVELFLWWFRLFPAPAFWEAWLIEISFSDAH